MTHRSSQRIRARERMQERIAHLVLPVFVANVVGALDLDADRKVVASCSTTPLGDPRVPRAAQARNELNDAAVATNEEMRRYLEPAQCFEIRMVIVCQGIGEQLLDPRSPESPRRKTDTVNHDELDGALRGTIIAIRRTDASRRPRPALAIQTELVRHLPVAQASVPGVAQGLGSSSSFNPRRAMRYRKARNVIPSSLAAAVRL